MPTFKLTYFNGMGRAEPTRIMFYMGGIKYQDIRLTREQWQELKPNTPFGQLPMLEVDDVQLCQGKAMEGFVARLVGVAGENDLDFAKCQMIAECVEDMGKPLTKAFFEEDEAKKKALKKEYGEKQVHEYLPKLNKLCSEQGYFVGDKVSWADIVVYNMLDTALIKFGITEDLPGKKLKMDEYHNLNKLVENLDKNEKITEWKNKRPDTEF